MAASALSVGHASTAVQKGPVQSKLALQAAFPVRVNWQYFASPSTQDYQSESRSPPHNNDLLWCAGAYCIEPGPINSSTCSKNQYMTVTILSESLNLPPVVVLQVCSPVFASTPMPVIAELCFRPFRAHEPSFSNIYLCAASFSLPWLPLLPMPLALQLLMQRMATMRRTAWP